MKSATLVFGFLLLAPILTAGPLPCVPGTLASYIALGVSGCAVGNIEFVNFKYASKAGGGAPEIPPDLIQVNPVKGIPEAASLVFTAAWQAAGGQSQESAIRYTVIVQAPHKSGSLTLQMGASQAGQPGVVVVGENTSEGDVQVYSECGRNCRAKTTDTVEFTPVPGGFLVVDEVRLSSASGDSSLAGFTAIVNLCPPCA